MARAQRRSGQGITIQAVAERAGVSAMTVSNVVNGTKKVRDDTRAAVLAAVEELGYAPNAAARALASAGTTRIGLVYLNAQNAFLSAVLVGALTATSRLGAQLLIRKCDTPGLEDAAEAMRALVRSGANALLLAPPYCELVGVSPLMDELTVPMAAVAHGQAIPGMSSVGIDERAAARTMTEMLVARGHKRIGFITGSRGHAATAERLAGFQETIAKADLNLDHCPIGVGDFSFESGLAAAEMLLDRGPRPTAIFASNDDMAAAVCSVAHRRGLRVPQDVAVAGFDDSPIAIKIWPTLTTIRQRVDLMAEKATESLIARHRSDMSETTAERLDFTLIVREST
jgi:LacI family transcriptional regulator